MAKYIKNIDRFTKNIILVFLGSSLINLFNFLYQLLAVRYLSLADFAGFNTLIAIFLWISVPISTLQMAIAKYSAEFKAQNQHSKIKFLLANLFRKALAIAILILIIFSFISGYVSYSLKIPSVSSVYILALLLALSCITPVLLGGLQGLELFKWFLAVSISASVLKLFFGFLFMQFGFNISLALGAMLPATLISIIIGFFALRGYLSLSSTKEYIKLKEILIYLVPVATSLLCYVTLTNMDMFLVRLFFVPEDSGLYSLAQVVGKIFLFLPMAISVVILPRTSGLKSRNSDTLSTLNLSLLYGAVLCVIAAAGYNLFPGFTLKVITGKALPESIALGRLFSISMTFFALTYILITYFLSLKDMRFIKYLIFFSALQSLGIWLFHKSLIQVQVILCINAILLFFIHLVLANFRTPLTARAHGPIAT